MTNNAAPDAVYLRQFEAGKAACKAAHGALADRWQAIGRQGCEATHQEPLRHAARMRDAVTELRVHNATWTGLARGRREGALAGLVVAFALAVVAGALGRWGR